MENFDDLSLQEQIEDFFEIESEEEAKNFLTARIPHRDGQRIVVGVLPLDEEGMKEIHRFQRFGVDFYCYLHDENKENQAPEYKY